MQAQTLDLTLPPEPRSVAEARSRVLEAVGPQLADGQVETLRLLVSELVTNAVRHGDHGRPVEIHAMWNAEVRIEVHDPGRGFELKPPPDDPLRASGWGLVLVEELADRWGVDHSPRTRVWFEMD